jgi:hypothetical protein
VYSKMGKRSTIEISPYRNDIEDMLTKGTPAKQIQAWLKKHGEDISLSSIYRYKNEKFNVQVEAAIKYTEEQSKANLDEASNKIVDDLHNIDNLIKETSDSLNIDNLSDSEKSRFLTNLYKAKYSILKDNNVELNVNNFNSVFDDDRVDEILKEENLI